MKVNLNKFKRMIQGCKGLVIEGELFFNGEKIIIQQLDPANVAMIESSCPCRTTKKYHIRVNVQRLFDAITIIQDNDKTNFSMITLLIDKNFLILQHKSIQIALMCIHDEDTEANVYEAKPNKVSTEKSVKVSINRIQFKNMIKSIDKLSGDVVVIGIKDNYFYVRSGADTFEDNVSFDNVIFKKHKDIKVEYSIEYIKKAITDKTPIFDGKDIYVYFNTDYPLVIEDSHEQNRFTLAPRVDNDYE